jgi:hypothetical protein
VNSVTLVSGYSGSDSWNAFTPNSDRKIWTSTYKGSTNTDTWYVPIRAATSYSGGSKTATKDVSLVNGSLARVDNAVTYKIIGYFNGPDDTKIAGLAKETASTTGQNGSSTYADTVWKTISAGDIIKIFEAIYRPNAPGTTDVFVQGETGKTAVAFTSDISKAALQLFHLTLASSAGAGAGDGIKIQGTELPTAGGVSSTNLIINDVGQPGIVNNSELPVFRIPDRRLGTTSGEYGYVRLRVNNGAQLVIEADNSDYISGGEGHPCSDGYFNGGCVEVMAGGKLRDAAYEGFPLGANAVILNRNSSYLAVGSETSFTPQTPGYVEARDQWYAGWLIGPSNGSPNPRLVWGSGNSANKYVEVRPGELAIDADVSLEARLSLIYSVFFLNNTTVSIDSADKNAVPVSDAGGGPGSIIIDPVGGSISNGVGHGSLSGLNVNIGVNAGGSLSTDSYRFYAVSDQVRIILKPSTPSLDNGIRKYALGGTLTESTGFIISGTESGGDLVLKGTLGTGSGDETYRPYSDTGISGYNKWWAQFPAGTQWAGTLVTALNATVD